MSPKRVVQLYSYDVQGLRYCTSDYSLNLTNDGR
ncbi:hypothetical protein FG05_35149 [Fusarium graminearum]|nr:hypothetical protein FG05_35149 [Fusarium graminearum]